MFALARELYGGQPWMIHGLMYSAYSRVLEDERSKSSEHGEKLNFIQFAQISAGNTPIFKRGYDKYGDPLTPQENSIAVTNINGPITKAGGASSRGMKEISVDLLKLDSDENIIGHIIQIDSGGGSSAGMEVMAHTIQNLKKPVVGLVERAGMAASAAYGILSHTDWAMAEDANSEVGSIGTMISFAGFVPGEKDFMGARHITAYATASTKKNKAFEEAIATGSTALLISEMLDPFNERFLATTKKMRPNILESQLDGSMYDAGEVVGTMVDAIGSFDDAVNKILELSKAKTTFNKNLKNNQTKAMTAQEILAQHPTAHAEIFGAGVAAGIKTGTEAEQERVKSWQVYAAVDPEAVNKGIESGKAISQSESHAFLLKATSKNTLEALNKNSAAAVALPEAAAPEATPEAVAHQKEVSDLFALATINKN